MTAPIRVLLVDDAQPDFIHMQAMLRRIRSASYELDWVRRYDEALESILEGKHELYLVDFRLGPDSGLDLIRRARQADVRKPIIMLTGHGSGRIDQAASEAGANDYLVKGEFDVVLLERSMRYAMRAAEAVNEISRLNAALEERLAARTSRLQLMQSAVDQAADGIMITDADLDGPGPRILYANPALERLTGYKLGELIGQSPRVFFGELTERGAVAKVQRCLEEGCVCTVELTSYSKSGRAYANEIRLGPVHDDAGQVTAFILICRDVTERNRAAEALRQAQKMDSLGQLTGGIAHDFNNLLSVVLGNTRLIKKRLALDPHLHALIEATIQAAERGAGLTQRLLAFARRQDLQAVAVDIPALVEGMADMLRRSLGPQVIITTEFAPGLPHARVDVNQLELAIINLAVNARDAMPIGGTLTITGREEQGTAAPDLPAGRYVVLSVTDTGQGMDEATLERALEPFFTTKGVGKGTGLGLSVVHGLAAQSGGMLRLASRKGQGTRADLWLPCAEPPGETIEPPLEPPREPLASRPRRILVVDDDALVLMGTEAMLEELGHAVMTATSGLAALELLRSDRAVDLLVTDVAMPGMTGVELASEVARMRPGLPVILATGYAELPGHAVLTMRRLNKPFRIEELQRAVVEALAPSEPRPPRAHSGECTAASVCLDPD